MCSTSAEGNVERMNYYVPIVRDDGVAQCGEDTVACPRRTSRIMVRRYALTSIGSKYLEIGIRVGPMADVEMVLGDNRGMYLTLPTYTWDALCRNRTTIEERSRLPGSPSMQMDKLTVEFCEIYNSPIVMMRLHNKPLYFKPDTVTFLLNLEPCIDYVYSRLYQIVGDVQTKFKTFVNVLQQSDVACETLDARRAAKIICDSEHYCEDYHVDCELLGCAINDILADARRKKC